LYEAKMIHQFDHRWATYVDAPDKPNGLDTMDMTDSQRADPHATVRPRYWVDECEVLARIARVPGRVANTWLAWHQANAVNTTLSIANNAYSTGVTGQFGTEVLERSQALTQALASWVAGSLFRRIAGQSTDTGWPAAIAWQATQSVENTLAMRHPILALALQQDNTTGKKALPMFTKWALQDVNTTLGDEELAELEDRQKSEDANVFVGRVSTRHRAGDDGQCRTEVRPTSATVSIATNASGTSAKGQFDLYFLNAWMDWRSPRWLMGWRDITNATNERTVIASVIPRVGVGHTMPLFYSIQKPHLQAAMLGNWSSLVFDYIARQKVGGTHLTYGYLKQFPILPPTRYTPTDLTYIVPRVLELTHTAHNMQAWADDLADYDPRPPAQRTTPFDWHPDRRAVLRAELDAYYARLYGLSREELSYILDPADVMGADYPSETFRGLKKNEEKAFGEYRTRRLVLAAWDAMGD